MDDVFNIINEIEELKSEIQSLKSESKYLRKKSEITPLIALYNHVRSYSLFYEDAKDKTVDKDKIVNKNLVYSITFYTMGNKKYSYVHDRVMALNDTIYEVVNNGRNKICNIKEVVKVDLVSNYKGIDKIFTYEFDK